MTLRQFIVSKYWARTEEDHKCICPFHGDRNPSAYLNDNTIYCFVCRRTYKLVDFQRAFGVRLEYVEQSKILDSLHSLKNNDPVLFRYNWGDPEQSL